MSIIYPSSQTATTVNRAIDNNMGTTTQSQGATADGLIISENLQSVVQCTNGMDYHITDKTITGTPPLSFHAIAQHLFDWSIDGNTDSGNGVGDITDNIFDEQYIGISTNIAYKQINVGDGEYTLSTTAESVSGSRLLFFLSGDVSSGANNATNGVDNERPLTVTSTDGYVTIAYRMIGETTPATSKTILNVGDTILPYEPYGYDIPIVVNNTDTYHCYITDVLRKSDGETPVYDTMSSDGTITRRVDTDGTPLEEPTTETYTAPDITVNWGWNTVDVDTAVTPSNMIINYKDD